MRLIAPSIVTILLGLSTVSCAGKSDSTDGSDSKAKAKTPDPAGTEVATSSATSTATDTSTDADGDDDDNDNDDDGVDDDDASPATAALTNPSEVIGTIGGALASVPTSFLAVEIGLNLASTASGDVNCTEHGEPLRDGYTGAKGDPIADGDLLGQTDPNYPAKLFFCLATLSADKGASVETLLGSIAQVQSVFCSFERGLGAIEYTAEGKDLLGGSPKEITLTEECWPNGAPEGMTSITFDSATATTLDASTGYQKELAFSSESAGVDYRLRFFNKDGIIGFKKIDQGVAPAVGGYSEMVLDSNTGVILVNTVDDRGGGGGADSAYRRVVRMKVTGTLDANLKFTSLASLQGIRANSGASLDDFAGASLKGDEASGYYGHSVQYSGGAFDDSREYEGCSGANASCTASGLLFTTSSVDFYSSREAWATHLESGLPPCDDGADISFAATPATGAFGKCAE